MDIELPCLVHRRSQLGKPTVLEVNERLPGVQRCNPVHAHWNDSHPFHLLSQRIAQCDPVQVISESLTDRLAPRIEVVSNKLPQPMTCRASSIAR